MEKFTENTKISQTKQQHPLRNFSSGSTIQVGYPSGKNSSQFTPEK